MRWRRCGSCSPDAPYKGRPPWPWQCPQPYGDADRHSLRHLTVAADDLVGRPSEQDLADLQVEGMIGTCAAKLMSMIDAGGSDAVTAKRALERLFVEYQRGQDAA
jgi:hypothetical protein